MADGTIRIGVVFDTKQAKNSLQGLTNAVQHGKDEIQKPADSGGSTFLGSLREQLAQVEADITRLKAKLVELRAEDKANPSAEGKAAIAETSQDILYAQLARKELIAQIRQATAEEKAAARQAAEAERAAAQQAAQEEKAAAQQAAETAKSTESAARSTERLSRHMRTASTSARGLSKSMSGAAFKAMHKGISKAIGSVKKLGFAIIGARSAYMALRRAINAYMSANEELSNKMSGIWTSIGNIFGPVIEKVINLLGTAIGYVSKFASLLTSIAGISISNSKALNKQASATSSAGSAAAKASRQLAGFDEMNKLSEESSSGGGGSSSSSGYDWASAVTLPDWTEWMANAFNQGNTATAGAILAQQVNKILDAWDPAETAKNVSQKIHQGFKFCIATIENLDWYGLGKKISAYIKNMDWSQMANDLFHLLGDVFGALGSLLVGLFEDAFIDVGKYFKEYIKEAQENGKSIAEGILQGIGDALVNIGEWVVKNIFKPFWDGLRTAFDIHSPSKKMQTIGEQIGAGLLLGIKNYIGQITSVSQSIWNGIKTTFSGVSAYFTSVFSAAWSNVKAVFSNWGSFFSGLWNTIKNTFTSLGTSLGNAIGGAVKNGINSVISMIQSTINRAISIINSAITMMNKVPGVSVSRISSLYLPRLAQGGVVNNPGRGVAAIIGEAGREAVLPLDRNTEWMDILADKIGGVGGNMTVPVYLSGKKIAEYVIDLNQKRAFALNGG